MSILSLAVLVIVALVLLNRSSWWDERHGVNQNALTGLVARYGFVVIVLAVLFGVGTRAVIIIPAGHRGVVFNTVSGIRAVPMGEGINFAIPVVEQVALMDIRVQKDTYDASAASKDMQIIHTKVAMNFHPTPESVPKIFQSVGMSYSERVIQPAVQEAVKATTARFTAEELITRREDVKHLIKELVEKQVTQFGLIIDELYITDFDFSRQFAEAIEMKQIAEQQALKAKRDLDRIKIEADQKIATSRAEAEALKMQRDAITPGLIQLRQVETQKLAIEKWDGKMPSVMMGQGGATPLLDLSGMSARPR